MLHPFPVLGPHAALRQAGEALSVRIWGGVSSPPTMLAKSPFYSLQEAGAWGGGEGLGPDLGSRRGSPEKQACSRQS